VFDSSNSVILHTAPSGPDRRRSPISKDSAKKGHLPVDAKEHGLGAILWLMEQLSLRPFENVACRRVLATPPVHPSPQTGRIGWHGNSFFVTHARSNDVRRILDPTRPFGRATACVVIKETLAYYAS
jgi:hypothetical protein